MVLIHPFIGLKVPSVLNPPGEDYFISSRKILLGIPLADFEPKGEERVEAWQRVQAAFDALYGWLKKSPGPYFMGETVSFVDFVVGGLLYGLEVVFGDDSQEWKDISGWNDGGWAEFKKNLEPYANTDN
jgi:glutathione S-transferase